MVVDRGGVDGELDPDVLELRDQHLTARGISVYETGS